MNTFFILGLGVSGKALVKILSKEHKVYVYESYIDKDKLSFLDKYNITEEYIVTDEKWPEAKVDKVIKSPGIKPNHPLIEEANLRGIPVLSDVEMGFLLGPKGHIIGITGTNGKTTTTMLIHHILSSSGKSSQAIGNIGVGVVEALYNDEENDYHVIELSSYQLAHTNSFKPEVAVITNITPDHLDWHGSYEQYVKDKLKMAENMTKDEYLILNYDDEILKKIDWNNKNVCYFSTKEILKEHYYIQNQSLYYQEKKLFPLEIIPILGMHNVENVMAAVAVCQCLGLSIEDIIAGIKSFKAVEHRIEPCGVYKEVHFYNDSKGTNPDASIKAIDAIDRPIILIAGGYDKGSDFTEFLSSAKEKVKGMTVMGNTAEKMIRQAQSVGFKSEELILVKDMEEAVATAFEMADSGDAVLLSPACASWGMYPNYEVRGNDFKEQVLKLKDDQYGRTKQTKEKTK